MLTSSEEKEIMTTCQLLQELGFGLSKEMVTAKIADFLKASRRSSPFKNGLPGPNWWEGFLRQWPQLGQRKPHHLSADRAGCANQLTEDSWFSRVQAFYREKGLVKRQRFVSDYEQHVWNCDESDFCLGVASKRILARRGA